MVRNKLKLKLERSGVGAWHGMDVIGGVWTTAMTDYEKQREENIRKNNQLLAELGLDTVKGALEPGRVCGWSLTTRRTGSTHRSYSVSQAEHCCLGN